ncbi:nitrilase-related carbon-nitrogen hydrolase, partial [Chloroflexota bacterium]
FSVTGGVKLITFGEYAITGLHHAAEPGQQSLSKKEIIDKIAIRIPGPITDVLANKAKQYGIYIGAQNLENDPEWPDLFFNTGFIINPEGKIILKYRKTVTNVPIAIHCTAHDIMDAYKNPITGKYDPFPVVNTSIGKLAVMVCGDLLAPEIPRVYSMKGAELVLHLTSGMSTDGGGIFTIGAVEAAIQTRAFDNAIYFVHSNVGPELGAYSPRVRVSGWSSVYDYTGLKLVSADFPDEQILYATIDMEAARKFRAQYFKNTLSIVRTELYAPFYSKPIYPANTLLRDGPIEEQLDEKQQGYFRQAMKNLKACGDCYEEKDV